MSSFVVVDILIHALCMVSGLMGNSFILIAHFMDWLRTRDLNPCNLILNGIAISNIFLQGTVVFQEVTFFLFFDFYIQGVVSIILFVTLTVFSLSSLCCSTCLCFYYFVKILQIHGTLFYKLKAKIPIMVPWLLAFSVVVSLCVGIPSYWDIYMDISIITINITGNLTTMMFPQYKSRCSCILKVYNFVFSVAFTLILLTTGAIITSLCQHIKRMKQNNESHGRSRINTHLSAAKTMTSLLLIYLLFYVAFTLINSTAVSSYDLLIICFILLSLFPTMNSIILILGNRNLTNVLKKLLCMQLSFRNTEVTVTTYQ